MLVKNSYYSKLSFDLLKKFDKSFLLIDMSIKDINILFRVFTFENILHTSVFPVLKLINLKLFGGKFYVCFFYKNEFDKLLKVFLDQDIKNLVEYEKKILGLSIDGRLCNMWNLRTFNFSYDFVNLLHYSFVVFFHIIYDFLELVLSIFLKFVK